MSMKNLAIILFAAIALVLAGCKNDKPISNEVNVVFFCLPHISY